MPTALRITVSLVLGSVTAVAIISAGLLTAHVFWPAYTAAIPHKHYTLAMLITRLTVGAFAVAGAACATTAAAGDRGCAAWYLGALFLVISIPNHLYPGYVWHDYPVWYHLIYLAYLVPVAGFAARIFRKLNPPRQLA